DRMAGYDDEAAEQSLALHAEHIQVQAVLSPLDVASDLFMLALERLAAPDQVDRAVLRGPHEPGGRPLGNALGGPLLERGDKGVLCELLGGPDLPDDASQPGDEPGRLDAPDRFDRAMRFGGSCLAATWALGRVSVSRSYG